MRVLCLTSIALLTCTICVAKCQSDSPPGLSLRRSLLDNQSDLTKAEGADCREVKQLPEGIDKCAYVKENCAAGTKSPYCHFQLKNAIIVNRDLLLREEMVMCRLNHILCGDILLLCETCWAAPNHPIPGNFRTNSSGLINSRYKTISRSSSACKTACHGFCCVQVACILWLLLLFRVLGSTAENFFSPILTQLSQEMGLPPRFAGGALATALFKERQD